MSYGATGVCDRVGWGDCGATGLGGGNGGRGVGRGVRVYLAGKVTHVTLVTKPPQSVKHTMYELPPSLVILLTTYCSHIRLLAYPQLRI